MIYRTIKLEGHWVIQKKRSNFIQRLFKLSEWKIVRFRFYELYVNSCYKFQKYSAIFNDHKFAIEIQNILEELDTYEILKYDKYTFTPIIFKSRSTGLNKYHIKYISKNFYYYKSQHEYGYRLFSKEECKETVDEILVEKNRQKQLKRLWGM